MAALLQPERRNPMLAAVLAIVFVAPFERVLFTVPGGVTFTTVEIVLLAAVAIALRRGALRDALAQVPAGLLIAGLVFGVALSIAAVAAPIERGNAVRFVMRLMMAALVFAATLHAVRTRDQARAIVRSLVAVATLVASIAVLEAAEAPAVITALTAFRPGFHVVAGQLRATSTLVYPTIASMYLEVAFALGLWLLLDPSRRHPRVERSLAFIALVVIGAGISATFTRAGLLTIGGGLVTFAALRLRRAPRAQAGLGTLTALAAVLIGVVFLSHSPELLASRMTIEGTHAWYGAEYDVPERLMLRTGRLHRVPIGVTNTGRLTWDSTREPAFAMAYHWLRADSERVVQFEGQRTAFSSPIAAGDRVTLAADVIAPGEPGDYILVWDVVHETRSWLSTEGVEPARTRVNVAGPPSSMVMTTMDRLPPPLLRPGRPALWSAALEIAAEHPWLGVGPDNYRHAYGPRLGMARWDRRVHANNMYLEVLTGAGVVGFIPFVALCVAAGVALWRRCAAAPAASHVAAVAALTVWVTVTGHGLVDSFLSFSTTYATFAVAAGLAFSCGLIADEGADAHRV